MTEYKPNSNRFKEEKKKTQLPEKRVEKVVTGQVITRKKSGLQKFTDEFISGDVKNITSYALGEILIPAAKKAISDIVATSIDMILYGGSRPGSKRTVADRVSYRNYYDNRPVRDMRAVATNVYSLDDIVLATRAEAQKVLDRMDELIDAYGVVRVADLYDLVGITGQFTDNSYGWMNIRNAEIVRVRDGYIINMPKAVPIER